MTAFLPYLPALVCGATIAVLWKCLDILDSIAKPAFKRQVAGAITSSSLFTLGTRLPTFCVSAFEAIFTDRIWSMRGFVRSCIGSITVVSILFGVWLSNIPQEWHLRVAALATARVPSRSTWYLIGVHGYGIDIDPHGNLYTKPRIAFAQGNRFVEALSISRLDVFVILPFFYNLFADFVALNVTWLILCKLASLPDVGVLKFFVLFTLSSLLLLGLSFAALDVTIAIISYIVGAGPQNPLTAPLQVGGIANLTNFTKALFFPFYKNYPNKWNTGTLYGVFVWSTLTGIIWIGVFGASVIVANISVKLKGIGFWLNRNLEVQRMPFKILAFMIAIPLGTICFVCHVLRWIF